ncbi:hypothetical protein EGW08_009950 [Elysia chlorotica]|uniref:Large ribosomal subunit protein mL50 n=1 Tax=Elysia chlorotica TaxID=188477 RepID=A0A3S1A422_ELYCH|nr:hypothetical protein EGW08_009950 [Elysia chlorotica]
MAGSAGRKCPNGRRWMTSIMDKYLQRDAPNPLHQTRFWLVFFSLAFISPSVQRRQAEASVVRGYSPAPDVEEKIISTASDVLKKQADSSTKLDDRLLKFKVLTRLMAELDHPIPSTELSTMDTVGDVVTFFSTPVVDRSVYEDLSKLNLPKNLHIQMEPVRFDPETDTFFDGQTAFPGRPTVVTSLKYRRKYKGHSGESRNQRSITEFERQKEVEADRQRLGWKRLPSEGE